MARGQDDDALKLKRERAGRYVTADGRFAVEGDAAGAWYVIDSGRLDGLGLPLVRGPFPTLDAAREAVADARGTLVDVPSASPPPSSPAPGRKLKSVPSSDTAAPPERAAANGLAEAPRARPRLRALANAPAAEPPAPSAKSRSQRSPRSADRAPAPAQPTAQPTPSPSPTPIGRRRAAAPLTRPDDAPAWMARLTPNQQADARRLLSLLERAGIDDPALVRREIEAGLPEVVRALLARTVRRDAIDPWSTGAPAIEALTAKPAASAGGARNARVRAAKAAAGRLIARNVAEDLGLFAWLVALQTSVRIFETLAGEGRDAGHGVRGWRLEELGSGRAATGRTLAIDEPDLLGE